MTQGITVPQENTLSVFQTINAKSNRIMTAALLSYFAFGLFLATFYNTWTIAIGAGGLCLLAYFASKILLPQHKLYQYVLSAVLAIFSAQFIYQMHGMFEMHFFFFVGAALLITYRNWKLILPLMVITVVHHALFAWLQYTGLKEIYFTQMAYMDLQTFLFHAGLAAVIMGICAYWSYDLGKTTLNEALKTEVLEKQLLHVTNNIAFAEAIAQGNLDEDRDVAGDDELGRSLVRMRDSIRESSRREEEDKFITVGVTKVTDIIRKNSNDPVALADEFIRGVVKYCNINQGALFLHESEEKDEYLRLASCYAYDRKKHLEKNIAPGEGIVGQCFLEREPIYMTAVPKNYVKITSGLGEATPQSIYVVPVKTNDDIVGVIEVASFRPLLPFEKEFMHRAAENIASAIVSARTTSRIKMLLEDSQQRAEEMRAQEEEMRQNMEELQATQEEMARKQLENENRMRAIDESGIASVEFDLDGKILNANEGFLKMMDYRLSEVQGKHHRMFVDPEYAYSEEYRQFWDDLRNGKSRPGKYQRIKRSGERVVIQGCYSIIRDHMGRPGKVLKLATDITELSRQQVKEKNGSNGSSTMRNVLQAETRETISAEVD